MATRLISKPTDSWVNKINNIPMPVHFYYLDRSIIDENSSKNLAPITQSGVVMSVVYTPFLEQKDLKLNKIPYDQAHYGTTKETATSMTDYETDVNVYKITGTEQAFNNKKIGAFNRYDITPRQLGKFHWTNESKLYQYPYSYINVTDYINAPLLIKNEYIESMPVQDRDELDVYVDQTISVSGTYNLHIPNYKGDTWGRNEGIIATNTLDLPTSSSQYSQFMANSKSQFIEFNKSASRTETLQFADATTSLVSNLAMLGAGVGAVASAPVTAGASLPMAGGLISSGLTGLLNSPLQFAEIANKRRNRVEQSQAKIQDLMRSPRNVNLTGTDILGTLYRNQRCVYANRYTISEYYKNKLCQYWTLYGYKQNRLMTPNIKSRVYWNYIKTIDVNIDAPNLDKTEIDAIKEIYNGGVTFWHHRDLANENMKMYDYTKRDNVERSYT